jgi:hypothetical protein
MLLKGLFPVASHWLMQGAPLIVCSLALSGCVSDQKIALAQCKLELTQMPPTGVVADELHVGEVRAEIHMLDCMELKGYERDSLKHRSKKCDQTPSGYSFYAWCYHPTGPLARLGYWVESALD